MYYEYVQLIFLHEEINKIISQNSQSSQNSHLNHLYKLRHKMGISIDTNILKELLRARITLLIHVVCF